jgi:hypothetical protein
MNIWSFYSLSFAGERGIVSRGMFSLDGDGTTGYCLVSYGCKGAGPEVGTEAFRSSLEVTFTHASLCGFGLRRYHFNN